MKCPNCGFENKDNSLFCQECGVPIGDKKYKDKNFKSLFIVVLAIIIIFFLVVQFNEGLNVMVNPAPELSDVMPKTNMVQNTSNEVSASQEKTSEDEQAQNFNEKAIIIGSEKREKNDSKINEYELIIEDLSWTEAFVKCIEKGGNLVHIDSAEEYLLIIQTIQKKDMNHIIFWLGGRRDSEDYHWVSQDGLFEETILNGGDHAEFWMDGEPSFVDCEVEEKYMNMFYSAEEKRWVWNDVPDNILDIAPFYSGRLGFICEYETK